MSIKIKDPKDPSKEIEVFTQEEIDAAKKDATTIATEAASKAAKEAADIAIETYKSSNPDRTSEVEKLKNDLSEAQAKLEQAETYKGGGDDAGRDAQIERLRKERDEAVKSLDTKVSELTKTIEDGQKATFESAKKEALDKIAGEDVELRKKVELEFDQYRPDAKSPADIATRMEKAAQLAGVNKEEKPDVLDTTGGAGGKGEGSYAKNPVAVTPNAVKLGSALGITEEELKAQAEKNAGEKK